MEKEALDVTEKEKIQLSGLAARFRSGPATGLKGNWLQVRSDNGETLHADLSDSEQELLSQVAKRNYITVSELIRAFR